MAESTKMEFTVRTGTLVKIASVALGVALFVILRDIFALLVVAIVLAILVSPIADFCERHRLPRALGVAAVYVALLAFVGLLSTLIAQPIITEIRDLAGSLPAAWDRAISAVEAFRAFSVEHGLTDQLRKFATGLEGKVAAGFFGAVSGVFGGVLSFAIVLVLAFYFSTYAADVRRTAIGMAPVRWQPFLIGVLPRVERKMGAWLRGLLTLAGIMGVLVFIGLSILRVQYALTLALLAAAVEVVPYVGAPFAALVAVLLTFLQSPPKAIAVLVFFVVIQQLENHILVPKVMQRAVGVHPVVSIIALLIGAKLGGIPGALLAIPVAAGCMVFFDEYARERRGGGALPRVNN
jgi:predicted PurR-regulated permease PerM